MAIARIAVTADQEVKVLLVDEGHFADIKSVRIAPRKLTETLSAFANADGGDLYIGIEENKSKGTREWAGFKNDEQANGHLQAFEALFPLGMDFQYEFLVGATDGTLVLHAQVLKTRRVCNASDGVPRLRRGAQNLPVDTPEKLKRLQLDKGLASFETEPVSCSLEVVANSAVTIGFMLEVVPTAEPEAWLRKQQLIVGDKPVVAGILLFAEEPQAILPKLCGLKITRYETKEASGTREALKFDPITIEGCAYEQIRLAVRRTVEIVEQVKVMGEHDLEEIRYPREALHEIIANAVLHRDYSIADDVHVRVFDNRIEVESPGRLPGHVTQQNILDERFARNGQMVRIINKFRDAPNKDIGEGLNTAFEAMRSLGLKPPEIHAKENSVLVVVRHERLAAPEQLVVEYLGKNESITNSVGRTLCHIGSENRMKRVFEKLMSKGLIERIPGLKGNKTAYQKSARKAN